MNASPARPPMPAGYRGPIPPQAYAQAQAQAQAHAQAQRGHPSQKRSQRQEAQAQQERRQEGERYQRELENRANLQAEAEKRRARVPTDKNIPPGVDELIVGDGVAQYARLRDVERKLDAIMMRKRLDLQDPLRTKVPKFSTLKIWISNTVDNQPWQGREFGEDAFDFSMGPEAVFKVKIEGRVLDEDPEETPAQNDTNGTSQEADDAMDVDGEKNKESSGPDPEQAQPQPKKRPKFSHFFKSITVEFDRNKTLQPENLTQIEWKKPKPPQTPGGLSNAPLPAEADFDCLEFERKSDENINCHVNLFRDEHPERFRLSKDLSQLLDMGEDDRGGVITAIYDYAKAMGLLGEEDKRLIRCDDRLRAVFKTDAISYSDLQKHLEPHLLPLEPISLPYTIRCDEAFQTSPNPTPTVYILRLHAPYHTNSAASGSGTAPAAAGATAAPGSGASGNGGGKDSAAAAAAADTPSTLLAALTDKATLSRLRASDAHVALLIQALANTKQKHAFLTAMASHPANFTNHWMRSQRKDLETLLGEGGRFEGEEPFVGSSSSNKDNDAGDTGYGNGNVSGGLRGEWLKGGTAGPWSGKQVEEAVAMMVGRKGPDGRAF